VAERDTMSATIGRPSGVRPKVTQRTKRGYAFSKAAHSCSTSG
jgi:hypothetical protein